MSVARHEKLHRLFREACRLPPEARAAFVEEACADAADLRRELQAMLAADAEERGSFDDAISAGGAQVLADMLADTDDLDAPDEPHPETIGRYRILRVIDRGGMGVVYEAEQDEPRRRVALKVVRSSMVTRELLRRFRHETQVLALLRHPGIAQIYEAGTADAGAGGRPFFAMELVDGAPITKHADAAGLDVAARLRLIAQLCDILHDAHQKGVIHRDLKPANILVTTTADGRATLKVLDFGVARVIDAELKTVTLHTTTGELVGTVPYMSPEQTSGEPDAIDIRTDVYAVGVIACELLTGRLPYELRHKPVHEAVRIIREQEPSSIASIDRSLRGDVDTIIAKALEKEKSRRYESAAAMARDIRRHLADEPIEARPASVAYQFRKFARRNRALVGGALATFVVAVVGAAIATAFAIDASRRANALQRTSYLAEIAAAASAVAASDAVNAAAHLDRTPVGHRGWEHAYLRAQLSDHVEAWPSPVNAAAAMRGGAPAFDPEGRRMFLVLNDRTIGVWEMASGRLVDVLRFDSAADKPRWRIVMHGPSLRFAATASDGRLVIRSLEDGAAIAAIDDPRGLTPLAWSPDGRRLLARRAGATYLWDGTDTRLLREDTSGYCAAFDARGERAVVLGPRYVNVLDTVSGERVARSEEINDELIALAFAGDGGRIVATGAWGNDFLLEGPNLATVWPLREHRAITYATTFDRSGDRFVTAAADGTACVWDTATRDVIRVCVTGFPWEQTVGLTPEGDTFVVAGADVRFFPLEDPRVLRGHSSYAYRVTFSPDGRLLASSAFLDPVICLWDTATGRLVHRWSAPPFENAWHDADLHAVPMIAFADDGRELVAMTMSEVRRWDVASGDPLPVGAGEDTYATFQATVGRWVDPFTRYETSADGTTLFVAQHRSDGRTILQYPMSATRVGIYGERHPREDAVPTGRFDGHSGPVLCVARSPDGTRIATGSRDRSVRIWDASTREELLVLRGHEDYVKDVAFSPDGTQLASASGDGTIRLWDTKPLHERRATAGGFPIMGDPDVEKQAEPP